MTARNTATPGVLGPPPPTYYGYGPMRERRSHTPPVVTLPANARDTIHEHARKGSHLETGGPLYETPLNNVKTGGLTIVRADGPGRLFSGRRRSLRFVTADVDNAAPGLIGIWHSHPMRADDALTLSNADVATFSRMRGELKRPPSEFVAILITPDPGVIDTRAGWRNPRLAVWIIGRDYYERATLKITAAEPAEPDDRAGHVSARRPRRPTTQGRTQRSVMVATRTFNTIDRGDPTEVVKGERIHPNHPIVKANPDAFKRSSAART